MESPIISDCHSADDSRRPAGRAARSTCQRALRRWPRLAGNGIQGADFRQGGQFGFLHRGDAEFQIVNGSERADAAFADDFRCNFGAQAFDEIQPRRNAKWLGESARGESSRRVPGTDRRSLGIAAMRSRVHIQSEAGDVDGPHFQAVALRVFHQAWRDCKSPWADCSAWRR